MKEKIWSVATIDKKFRELNPNEEARELLLKQTVLKFTSCCEKNNITESSTRNIKKKNTETIQQIYRTAFQFDRALALYLSSGKLKKIVQFVKDVEGKKTIIEVPYEDFYTLISGDLKIKNYSHGKSTEQLKREQQQLRMSSLRRQHIQKLQQMVLSIQKKMESNQDKKINQMQQAQTFTFLSQKAPNSEISRSILNRGDLNEAYAAARYDILYRREELPKSITYEWFFENYIKEVDNTPAIVQEDIERIDLGVSIAVKSSGATAPKLKQYLQAANIVKARIFSEKENKGKNQQIIEEELTDFKNSLKNEIKEKVQKKVIKRNAVTYKNKAKNTLEEIVNIVYIEAIDEILT